MSFGGPPELLKKEKTLNKQMVQKPIIMSFGSLPKFFATTLLQFKEFRRTAGTP
jgi:hypothetical protein